MRLCFFLPMKLLKLKECLKEPVPHVGEAANIRSVTTPPWGKSKTNAVFRTRYQKDLKSICPQMSVSFLMISGKVGRFLRSRRLIAGSGSFSPSIFTCCRFNDWWYGDLVWLKDGSPRFARDDGNSRYQTNVSRFGWRRFSVPAMFLLRIAVGRGQGAPGGRPRSGALASLMPPSRNAMLRWSGRKAVAESFIRPTVASL